MRRNPKHKRTTNLGIIATLLGLAPAGTALLAALLRTALGGTPGRLPLAALLGGGLPARRTSLGRHGSIECETTREAQLRSKPGANNAATPTQTNKKSP